MEGVLVLHLSERFHDQFILASGDRHRTIIM
jgi:hypothetical protein